MMENNQQKPQSKPAAKKTKPKKKKGLGKRIFVGFFKFIAVCVCIGVIGMSVIAVMLSMYLVEATANDDTLLDLENLKLSYTSIIYYKTVNASGQEEWQEYQRLDSPDENRIWVDIGNICDDLQNAYIAVEDRDFRTHSGFNLKRTVYAALNEVAYAVTGSYLRGTQQGASTINQQLIKNITDETASTGMDGYTRKLREIFRALSLNGRYSKDVILEAYLNTLGLTGNIGGVQAGANSYFGKDVGYADPANKEGQYLTIAECASIAAITKNPTEYSPISNPEDHLVRRNLIIRNMCEQGYITQAERDEALAQPLKLVETRIDENAAKQTDNSYFTDSLVKEVINDLWEANPENREEWTKEDASNYFYTKGLRIYSTVVPEVQTSMENVFNRNEYWPAFPIENYVPDGAPEGTEPRTITTQASGVVVNYKGELCGVVGGLGAKTADRTLNRAIDSVRQVGSTMKGVAAYPLAIEYDLATYSKTFPDTPFSGQAKDENGNVIKNWPKNYSGTYTNGPITVYQALKVSLNTVAVWIGDLVGAREMYEFATDTLNISSLDENRDVDLAPMVLGSMTNGMSPYELAGAYMMYGDGGKFTTLHSYTSVEDYQGNVVLEKDITTVQAIGEDTAFIMNRLLRGVLTDSGGTAYGMSANAAGMDSIAKTGTTNENRDIWFVGLTPYYVSAFWYGYDENEPMWSYQPRTGAHPGANAWREVMNDVQADEEKYPVIEFTMPENVVQHRFCTISGNLAVAGCPSQVGYFKEGVVPSSCPGHGAVAPEE